MNKKRILVLAITGILIVLGGITLFINHNLESKDEKTKTIVSTVMSVDDGTFTIQDSNNIIYTFGIIDDNLSVGDVIELEYNGSLNKNKALQDSKVLGYKTIKVSNDEEGVPSEWQDNGIFKDFYIFAAKKLKTMSLDEKIAQLLLVRYPDTNPVETLEKYQFGGYVFFEKDFRDKTKPEVKEMINNLQNVSKVPILTAVDEEGGTVVRVSSNPNLASSKFESPRDLYLSGGFEKIRQDTINKSLLLSELGLNLNLAPVVDVSTNSSDYMYKRTLGENTELTSTYAKTVISTSKGLGVSYTLKHFPGYGNNSDTHTGQSIDNRSYDDIVKNDLPPFEAGINEGAEAVLVSHNTVTNIDSTNIVSLYKFLYNDIYSLIYERFKYYEELMNIPLKERYILRFRDMTTLLGSNSRKTHKITLSYSLIPYSLDIISSVIVHELAHYYEFNHSYKFYNIVYKYSPNYDELQNKIKRRIYNK